MEDTSEERSHKRRRLNDTHATSESERVSKSLRSSISPPPLRRNRKPETKAPKFLNSPFQLTWIQDLPDDSNRDAVTLKDLLGDPMISECWEFNYLHDINFLMEAFDEDVRDIVKVHVVHGFWKQEDPSRQNLQLQAAKYKNVTLHTAFMPEMFGTHHSKMLILLRHDDMAQVIIHTANMIPFDWTDMTQAVWRSPLLPLIKEGLPTSSTVPSAVGSGSRFKLDLLNYLKAYDRKRTICEPLVTQLSKYDFSEVRAALVASVPGRQAVETDLKTSWGWLGLQNVLKCVPVKNTEPEIVVQISSIATLGQTDKWLEKTFFKALSTSKSGASKPKFKVIFPTADEIRRSLNGYKSGSAIHTKIQTAAQAKQLHYLKPLLCHWAGDGVQHQENASTLDAGRKRAAPHIKTYIRFTDRDRSDIDWMIVTSSNLSTQAWGGALSNGGDVRICSYEIGVMVWPALFGEKSKMVPTFKTDTPSTEVKNVDGELIIGARMPYDLPLVPYTKDDEPWCATASYDEPDWKGQIYRVEGRS